MKINLHSSVFHKWATIAWVIVGGTMTYFFPQSIAWVAFMSLYANIVSHWSAYQGARAEEK